MTAAKTFKLLAKDRPRLSIDILLTQVREVIMDHFGFRIWIKGSGQVFSFLQLEIDRKASLIAAIKDNAQKYMQISIPVTVSENSSSNVVGGTYAEQ